MRVFEEPEAERSRVLVFWAAVLEARIRQDRGHIRGAATPSHVGLSSSPGMAKISAVEVMMKGRLRGAALGASALWIGFVLGIQAAAGQGSAADPITVNSVTHISVFVRNVEKTARMYSELLGTTAPKIIEHNIRLVFPPDFKGDRSAHPTYAHIPFKNVRFELMEPVGGVSPWRDFLEQHGQGIQHLGFEVPDVPQALARFQKAGGKLIFGGCPGCTAHVDMREQLGYVVELTPVRK